MKNHPFRVVASNVDHAEVPYALTIAVPTFKRPALLEQTLRSIAALEFVVAVEVIVVDNDPEGDDAQAAQMMSSLITVPYCYYRNTENVGMFGNWNQCLFQARGTYLTILHDDDLLCPEFATAVNKLLRDNQLAHDIVGFEIALLEQRPDRIKEVAAASLAAVPQCGVSDSETMSMKLFSAIDLFFANPFCGTLAVIFDREKAIALGGFLADWAPIADYEFWCRWAARYGDIPIANWRVARYRIGQNESMKLETRTAFVTKSRELRNHLVELRAVPAVFAKLIGMVGLTQRNQIYRDWRTAAEPHQSVLTKVAMSGCGKALRIASKATKVLGLANRRARTEPR
ncbi:MAG: glycosyltransferase [Proteobacteria bacterium]|nr:MAG: glycosyltransferase [Pseudomonadota bacterium]